MYFLDFVMSQKIQYYMDPYWQGQTTSLSQLTAAGSKNKEIDGEIICSNAGMGGDPIPGFAKWCYCEKKAWQFAAFVGTFWHVRILQLIRRWIG